MASTYHPLRAGLLLAASVVVGQGSSADAQGGSSESTQVEVGVNARPSVSAGDMGAEADSIGRRGTEIAQRLTRLLGEARKDKDILRANCVNRKLTEVNATVRNVESRTAEFKSASRAGDSERSGHEFTVLSVLSQKLDMLDAEAAQCLGQAVFEAGNSQVVTTVPASAPSLDPTSVISPAVAPPTVTVPPSLSPNT
ncbi:MAG: hypothetical protein RL385_1550 [Pseudomonadota bacterium]|jgi:hypothetical protein